MHLASSFDVILLMFVCLSSYVHVCYATHPLIITHLCSYKQPPTRFRVTSSLQILLMSILIADLVDEYDSEMNWGAPSGDKFGSTFDEDVSGYEYDVDFEAEEEEEEEEQPSSNYGLRGSTFEEQSEANEKWKTAYCRAEKRAAVWEQRMKERTGPAREEAKERFAEAKAASAKAWARISEEGKSAWDAFKNRSTSIGKSVVKKTETWGEKAAHWWQRNNPFENEDEDEYEEMRSIHCMFVK